MAGERGSKQRPTLLLAESLLCILEAKMQVGTRCKQNTTPTCTANIHCTDIHPKHKHAHKTREVHSCASEWVWGTHQLRSKRRLHSPCFQVLPLPRVDIFLVQVLHIDGSLYGEEEGRREGSLSTSSKPCILSKAAVLLIHLLLDSTNAVVSLYKIK